MAAKLVGGGGTLNAAPGSILLAVHDFVARSPDELSLAKGDRIELIERDDEFGDGWFLGKHLVNGNSGLFPEVYTTPAPKGTLTSTAKLRANNDASKLAAQAAAGALAPSSQAATAPTSNPSTSSTLTTSQPLLAATPASRSSASSTTPAGRSFTVTSDSPVMSETLSVIDEHMSDMKVSPRNSTYVNGTKRDTIGSQYSNPRQSYIAGHETDEEESQAHTEAEVLSWDPTRVAEYLEEIGVEKSHCDVFIEQEISGEVLLAMDQNSLFIKEFDLGSVGRRLKTWHKIKALQDEVKQAANPEVDRKSVSDYSAGVDMEESRVDAGRNRSSTMGSNTLPRALTTKRNSGDNLPIRLGSQGTVPILPNRESFGISPLQSMTGTIRPENTHRPSAQGIRNLNHSRRHSSIDSTSTDGASRIGHRKQPSVDQKWQPGMPINGRHGHVHTASTDSSMPQRQVSTLTPASPGDLDRGYFSSNELEGRSTRRSILTKRNSTTVSPIQSRNGSILGTQPHRIAEAEGYRDPVSPVVPSSYHFHSMNSKFGGHRSATTPGAMSKPNGTSRSPITPVVTKLDPLNKQSSLSAIAASPTKLEDNASEASSDKATPSPSANLGFFSSAKAKVTGLRSISDAVTKDEKVVSPTTMSSSRTRTGTGTSTPSTENPSLDLAKSRESTGSGNNLMPPQPSTRRPRAKSKKFTSAYTRGLEKKSPQEQMLHCDYSGWMKKKSGSMVGTWKNRLFILRGRRLSYYYTDGDEEEKGLIDISFHRVLPAHDEKLTTALASITGAGSSGSPIGNTPTIAQQDLRDHPAKAGEADEGLFIFKLVPPKAGLAKGVNFTKPTVHYFAVNSRQEGRLWMAALMKATIDRDDSGVVTTTYNQKTISLAKARARHERPPALKEEGFEDLDDPAELDAGEDGELGDRGLGIGGLNENGAAVGGAESTKTDQVEDGSSIAPSTLNTLESDMLSEQEKEAIALNS